MRTRVLAALLAFSTLAVLAFAVPLALATSTARTHQMLLSRDSALDWFAALAQPGATSGTGNLQNEVDGYHALFGEGVLIADSSGLILHQAGLDPSDPDVQAAIDAARRNERLPRPSRLTPWSPDTLLLARTIGTGVHSDGVIVLRATTRPAKADIARSWGLVGAGAAAALIVVTALALALARWVVRPLDRLEDSVVALTRSLPAPGEAAPLTARLHSGPPEVRTLARSFDAMTHAVLASTEAQRQLIADTAHKLRNPLAALQIRLDSMSGEVPDEQAPSLGRAASEAERLGSLLDGMLRLAEAEVPHRFEQAASGSAGGCDVVLVVAERVDAWSTAFAEAGMTLTAATDAPQVAAAVSEAAVGEVLDAALSNAHRYAGEGARVTVSVTRGAGGCELAVTDDGPGVAPDDLPRLTERFYRGAGQGSDGTGLGLSIASALASAHGAQLRLEPVEPHGLRVVLRVADEEAVGDAS